MKKQDEEGKQILAGTFGVPNKISEIRKVIHSGKTVDEKKAELEKDKAKRLDEGK